MILQKILTGSALFGDTYNDKDYVVIYDKAEHNYTEILKLRPQGEDWFLHDRDNTSEESWFLNRIFFIIITYEYYKQFNIEYEINGTDYFESLCQKIRKDFKKSLDNMINKVLHVETSPKAWWYYTAINYIETNEFNLDIELFNHISSFTKVDRRQNIPEEVTNKIIEYKDKLKASENE